MDALIRELAALEVDTPLPDPPNPRPDPQEGDRVEIIRRDNYFGRTGVLISRHGRRYWNIRLDRLPTDTMNVIIYKAPTSFRRLTGNPQ